MGMSTGGIPTTDKIPETTEIFGCPTDNIPTRQPIFYDKIKCFKKSVVGYIVSWRLEYFSCLGYIVSCGYPTRTHTHTRENSVAHVWSLVVIFFDQFMLEALKI